MMQANVNSINYFNELAPKRLTWKKRNHFYHKLLEGYYCFYIPPHSKVLEMGCGTGELLNSVNPKEGLGIDSVDALELVVALQKKYAVRIDDQNQGRFIIKTVGTIADFIAGQLAERAANPGAAAGG